MSDIKRIQLTTISDVKKNSSDLNILSPSSSSKTTRYEINVDLFEPNAKSFPEFNYKKLLHAVKKKHKKTIKSPPNGISDPFEDNDADVERIAREFEKKYGGVTNSYSGGGKKSNRPKITTDLCDKGAGYDDNDSFIDNTEAYDELIPEEVDTVSGGFYINSGALEFKHLSNYERPEDAHKMPKPRKRILSTSSSSSESSDENDDEADENNQDSYTNENNVTVINKPKNNGHADKKTKVLNIATSDEEKQLKQTPPPAKPITKDKDKKVKKDKKDEVLTSVGGTGNTNINSNNNDHSNSVNSNTNASNNNNNSNNNNVSNNASSDRDKQIKTTTVKDMLRAKRDSILGLKESAVKGDNDVNDEESTNSSLSSSSSNEPQPQPIVVSASTITVPTIPKSPNTNTKDTIEISKPAIQQTSSIKLPASVSADLIKSVEELKDISQKHTASGAKTNFFDTKTMDVIMKIDTETRNGDSATRTSVFQFIEHVVPFTQKTIMGHIRKVRVQNEENKLTKYYNKLKSAVDLVLPSATETYKEECLKVNQIRSTMPSDDKIASNAPKMPRKRFPWNDNTRKLLFDLYTALKLSYNIVKPRKETVDSFIENYYKTKVIGIWPPGWMRVEELNKEIERRKLGVKKPKENKKPVEMGSNQSMNSVNSTINTNNTNSNINNNQVTTVPNQSNMMVDAVNHVTTKDSINNSSKSILSTNNAFVAGTKLPASQSSVTNPNVDKSNTAAISSSNSNQIYSKIDKTETNYDINKKSSSSGNTSSNQVSNASTINLTNSLTITPVKTTGSASSTSKPLPSVENKVTITNVETSTTPNSTNHHSSNTSSVLKSDNKSSKQSSSNNNNNLVNKSSSKQSSSSNVISISPAAGSTINNASNMQSSTTSSAPPVRKTSDYSINSIMSTATSSSTTGSNSLNLNAGHSNTYPSSKTSTSSSTVVTSPFSVNEICNINNKVSETIENSIKSKPNSNSCSSHHNTNNSNSNHNNNNNNLGHNNDSIIKVRSVANMNSSIRENTSSSRTLSQSASSLQSSANSAAIIAKKQKKTVHNSDDDYDDGDSDSSDVEIVDVYQPKRSKTMRDNDIEIVDVQFKTQQQSYTQPQKNKNIMINKNKYNKNSNVEPKLNNYISNTMPKLTGALTSKKEDSNMNKLNHQSTIDNDLDVSQIMKDLKELQELQQPKYSAMHVLDNNLVLSKQSQHPTGFGKSLKDSTDTNKRSSKNS